MIIDLTNTTSSKINNALIQARRRLGSPTLGRVLTLVIVTDERGHYDSLKAAITASREHPARILVVIGRPGRSTAQLDAEVRVGEEAGPGETVVLRLHGRLADHAASVVLPLLLPDAPVVAWWPWEAPRTPEADAVGALAQRRVTDAAATDEPLSELTTRASGYRPGDTDLAWTRLTPWRSLLAAALDQNHAQITAVEVASEPGNPSAALLVLWLGDRLAVPTRWLESEGPGITAARLVTTDGDIGITRPDGVHAVLSAPGEPDRMVALRRRGLAELVAEELRRLDPDDVYASTIRLAKDTSTLRQEPATARRTDGGTAPAGDAAPVGGGTS